MADQITYRTGPWRFVWHGGRLADVYHAESDTALDCTQVGEYDWQTDKVLVPFTRTSLKEAADEWVRESSADYLHELPYLM
jgi:hypothetical protein